MSMSLREQLLAAGLGNKQQAKKAEQEERQRTRTRAAKEEEQKRIAQAQEAARAAKAARDLELNRQQQEKVAKKARFAEIKQLIEQHRLPKLETDEYFNFIHRQKVRRMAVDAPLRERLVRGDLVIVRCEGKYDVVPAEIAARIRERDERAVVSLDAKEPEMPADDPYKEFVVPDDLMW